MITLELKTSLRGYKAILSHKGNKKRAFISEYITNNYDKWLNTAIPIDVKVYIRGLWGKYEE